MPKISIRLTVALMCAAAVVVTSVIIIAISTTRSTTEGLALGRNHAFSLSEIALVKTENYLKEMELHARHMQVVAKRAGFMLPKDDPDPLWYKKWHDLIEIPIIGSNYSYVHVWGAFADESVVRCKVLPRGPGLTGRTLSSYIYNPWHTPAAEQHQYYLGNQSVVPEWDKEHYPFPNINGTRFQFFWLVSELTNNTVDSAYWVNFATVAFPSEVVMPTGVPIHNGSGHFIGHILVVRTFDQVNDFLLSVARNIEGAKAFVVGSDGLMVGTTEKQPSYTQVVLPSREGIVVDKYCAVSPPTDPFITLTCRTHVDNYSFTGLKAEFYRTDEVHRHHEHAEDARNWMAERTYDGEDYFVVFSHVVSTVHVNFDMRMFLFYPTQNVVGGIQSAARMTIALGAVVAVVSAVLAVLAIHFVLLPLNQLGKNLRKMGSLRTTEADKTLPHSRFSEIFRLEKAFDDMHSKLLDLKRFVPHALFSMEHTPSGPGSGSSTTGGDSLISVDDPEAPIEQSVLPKTEEDELAAMAVFSPTTAENPLERVRSFRTARPSPGLDKVKLKTEMNVFHPKKCTVLSLQVEDLPDEAKALQAAVSEIMLSFIDATTTFGGVIDLLRPHRCIASFNAHSHLEHHERNAVQVAMRIHVQLRLVIPHHAYSIVVDSTQHLVGVVGAGMHSAVSLHGEGLEMLDRLHNAARSYYQGKLFLTERVASSIEPKTFLPIDILRPLWLQENRTLNVVVCEPQLDLLRPGFRKVISLLLSGEFSVAAEAIRVEMESTNCTEHQQLVLQRFLVGSERCAMRSDEAFGRREIPRFESLGIEPQQATEEAAPHQGTEETEAIKKVAADVLHRQQPPATQYQEQGLIGMFVPEQNTAEESVTDLEEFSRSLTDHRGTHWKRIGEPIGSGAFSVVYKGISERGTFCAMKFRKVTQDTELPELASELDILSNLHHENIVSYYSCCSSRLHLVLVMEYLSCGTLRTVSRAFNGLPTEILIRSSRDTLTGLAFLHSKNIVHCDLKPENILVNADGSCKLSDFGAAVTGQMSSSNYLHLRGTAAYMAPEVARGEPPVEQSDIWSFAVTMLEMATNKPPWPRMPQGIRAETSFVATLATDSTQLPELNDPLFDCNPEFADVLERCLQRDPRRRPSAQQLLASTFFH